MSLRPLVFVLCGALGCERASPALAELDHGTARDARTGLLHAPTERPDPTAARRLELGALSRQLGGLHGGPSASRWRENEAPAAYWRRYAKGDLASASRYLYLQPLGALSPAQMQIVSRVSTYLEHFYAIPVRFRRRLPLSLIPSSATRRREGATQIYTQFVLHDLLAPRMPADAAAYLSITASDLWPGRGYAYVFGQASLERRVGVWSVHRDGAGDGYAPVEDALVRPLRVALHETGHLLGLHHCSHHACVMNEARNAGESDELPPWLCPDCLAKLLWRTDADPIARFEALAELAEAEGLPAVAAFYRASASALGQEWRERARKTSTIDARVWRTNPGEQ